MICGLLGKKGQKKTHLYWFIYAINKLEGYTIKGIDKNGCMRVWKTGQIQDDKGGKGCHCIHVHLFLSLQTT